MTPSTTHLVAIPSFNTGDLLLETVRRARAEWNPVWVIIDGSTDGSAQRLAEDVSDDPGVRVLALGENRGKGAAIHHALRLAAAEGYTHLLTMDADGQHPPGKVPEFMARSVAEPRALIAGVPVFGAEAPALRVRGRRISNAWVRIETLGTGARDSLFGFRVYPIVPLLAIMDRTIWMRRFDFDPEAAVRLNWAGVPTVNLSAPVRYLSADEGGVSHFRYGRDNTLLTAMHIRLMLGWLFRWPVLVWQRRSGAS
ncbi:MAG: glycosyltransferase family 2 protein [Gammaproteobacteria bacterium]|nr:glycosyltransferase family 2 protein [Gammaproteobacteria bacterium]